MFYTFGRNDKKIIGVQFLLLYYTTIISAYFH